MAICDHRGRQIIALRIVSLPAVALAVFAMAAAIFDVALAQQAPGQTPQGRDCQTVRTCNFSRTGSYRGCLSSYSCRACRMVAVKCTLPNTGTCRELRCDWGG